MINDFLYINEKFIIKLPIQWKVNIAWCWRYTKQYLLL